MSTNEGDGQPHFELIKAHAACQEGMYFNGTYRDEMWFGGFSRIVSDMFWNFVTPLQIPDEGGDSMYTFFGDLDREPALYGESEFIEDVAESIGLENVEAAYTDQWMEFEPDNVDVRSGNHRLSDVRDGASVDDFLNVFTEAYGDSNADDPYGGLPSTYMEALEAGLRTPYLGDKDSHLIGYDSEDPVAIGSVIGFNNVAIIYNMGTLPSRQGEGIGSRLAEQLIRNMLDAGFDRILLQTERGSYVEDFYSGLGFERLFQASGMTNEAWTDRFTTEN